MDDLYSENIVDHYKNPRHFGDLVGSTHQSRGANASCGDMIEFAAVVTTEGKISDLKFKGVGCALSTASASMLSEKILNENLTIETIRTLTVDDITAMMGIDISPTRMKCVMLPLRVLHELRLHSNG